MKIILFPSDYFDINKVNAKKGNVHLPRQEWGDTLLFTETEM